jgi:hypothetical protein
MPENYENEKELTDYLYKSMHKLHEEKNKPINPMINMDSPTSLNFTPELLIGTKVKDDEFYVHHIGFGNEYEQIICNVPTVDIIYDYKIIGSGSVNAISSLQKIINHKLKPLDKKISEMSKEINVGIIMYLIDEAKEFDLYSGGDTQIGIIDNNGFKKITIKDQPDYYYRAIKYLCQLLEKDESEIKKFLPVSIKKIL